MGLLIKLLAITQILERCGSSARAAASFVLAHALERVSNMLSTCPCFNVNPSFSSAFPIEVVTTLPLTKSCPARAIVRVAVQLRGLQGRVVRKALSCVWLNGL